MTWNSDDRAEVAAAGDLGTKLIYHERLRQMTTEGWAPEHDDIYVDEELIAAAVCYALGKPAFYAQIDGEGVLFPWPWELSSWKPSPDDRIRELTKAGALIAAEIDRLGRDGR